MASQPTAYPYPSTVTAQIPGTLSTSSEVKFVMPFKGRLAGGACAVTTAPVGAALTLDIKKGSTVMGSFSVAAGASSDDAIALSATEAYTTFAAGEVVTVDVSQVGSSTAGANLMVTLVVDQYNLDGAGTNEYSLTVRRGAHDGGVLTAANVNTYQLDGSSTAGAATGVSITTV